MTSTRDTFWIVERFHQMVDVNNLFRAFSLWCRFCKIRRALSVLEEHVLIRQYCMDV